MRWPWQPRPGMVRVSRRRYIELLEACRRADELEAQIRESRMATARFLAQAHVLDVARTGGGQELPVLERLVDQRPLTADGDLHEEAFAALVDATVWEHRERELAHLAAGDRGEEAR